jgi:hypothetical protein
LLRVVASDRDGDYALVLSVGLKRMIDGATPEVGIVTDRASHIHLLSVELSVHVTGLLVVGGLASCRLIAADVVDVEDWAAATRDSLQVDLVVALRIHHKVAIVLIVSRLNVTDDRLPKFERIV